jgi:hypothetical protein
MSHNDRRGVLLNSGDDEGGGLRRHDGRVAWVLLLIFVGSGVFMPIAKLA